MTDRVGPGALETGADPADDSGRSASLVFRVRFDEATPGGLVRTSALLRYAADLAWVHSGLRGFGRSWYAERGLAWVVRGVELDVLRPVGHGDELVGTTEAVAARKVIARRSTVLATGAGQIAARLTVDWALTTTDGVPTRIPPVFATVFTMPETAFAPIRVRATPPEDGSASTVELAVRPHELDPMGHVNNAVYLDWAEEAIRAAGEEGVAALDAIPRRWRLEYLGAAAPGSRARTVAWPDGGGWSCRISDPATGLAYLGARLEV
jgi:acyl-CoA thioesterase FadM